MPEDGRQCLEVFRLFLLIEQETLGNTSLRFEKNVVDIQLAVKSRETLEQLCVHNLVELGSKASSVLSTGKLSVNLLSNSASRRSKVSKYSRFISSTKVVVRFPDSMKFFPSVKVVTNCFRCLVIF